MKSLRVFKSSAGSGKTFTLVSEFLSLVIQRPQLYRHILAVTFTNKAANELKSRIISALDSLRHQESDSGLRAKLMPLLVQSTGFSETEISERSAIIFHHILHHYSELTVVTIDAFVQRLSRTFTRELNLPPAYEIMLDAGEMARKTVDLLLDEVGEDPLITKVLIDFVMQRMEDESDWRVENQLQSFVLKLFDEEAFWASKSVEILDEEKFHRAASFIRDYLDEVKAAVGERVRAIFELLSNSGIQAEDLSGGSRGLAVLLRRADQLDFVGALTSRYGKQLPDTGKWVHTKASQDVKQAMARLETMLNDAFIALIDYMERVKNRFYLFTMLDKQLNSLALQQQIEGIFQAISSEQNLVHISAFNKKLSLALQNSSVPYIYERLGERYQNFLIDEFQDTSLLQWHNFLPLIENGQASGKLSLIVGDAKQAIYRFRSGEVEQFIMLPKIYGTIQHESVSQVQSLLTAQYDERKLGINYRSFQSIVEFNNDFFAHVSVALNDQYRAVYQAHQQLFTQHPHVGLVQLSMIEKNHEGVDANFVKSRQLIEEALASGFALRDIAMLFRAKDHAAEASQFLIEHGIPVISSESILLKYSPKVQLLIHALRYFYAPENPLHTFGLIFFRYKVLFGNQPDYQARLGEVFELYISHFHSPKMIEASLLVEKDALDSTRINALSFYDLCEYLIRIFNLSAEADPYLQFFLELVFKWQNQRPKGLADFLEYWDTKGKDESVVVPESTNAVRIMTIHKAKGLEFPVVIFPYAMSTFNSKPTRKDLWVDLSEEGIPALNYGLLKINKTLEATRFGDHYTEEIEKTKLDNLNLLYVALTRAVERLYVLVPLNPNSKSNFFVNFLQDKELWNESLTEYVFGVKEEAVHSTAVEKTEQEFVGFVSSAWDNKLYIAADPTSQWQSDDVDVREFGKLVHSILGHIDRLENADRVIQKYLRNGTIDEALGKQLLKKTEMMAEHKWIGSAFANDAIVINETEIITPQGEVLRPDRYAELHDRVILIDYKTGSPKPEHQFQLKKYQSTLKEMINKPSKAYLVYLDSGITVVECA